MAVMEAQQWCDDFADKEEMADIVSKRSWFNVPKSDIIGRLKGEYDYGNGKVVAQSPHFMKFWRDQASFPFKSHDTWFLTENIRWGKLAPDTDIKALVGQVNGADIWREAAKTLGVADIPASDSRGKETFFDGKVFDPDNPATYLASLAIKRIA
jgi:nitrate/nitrite transport system substrate-binding protein